MKTSSINLLVFVFATTFLVGLSRAQSNINELMGIKPIPLSQNGETSVPSLPEMVKKLENISGNDDNSSKLKIKDGFLPLPKNYNKLAIPLGINSNIFVAIRLLIHEVLSVDTKTGIIELDTDIRILWIDWNIWEIFDTDNDVKKLKKPLIFDGQLLQQIWTPDIFIEEMVDKTSLFSNNLIRVKLLMEKPLTGAILVGSRQTLKIRCGMDFHYFPFDVQKCPLHIRSYAYDQDKLFLKWYTKQSVFLNTIKDSSYDIQVSNVEPGVENFDQYTILEGQRKSTLSFTLELRRNFKYHFVQTYTPSVLLILITGLCFIISPDMLSVRVSVCVTALLTLTAMFTSVREQSPQVSYVKAIDIWMVFCVFLVFLALVLFTFINWMKRRLVKADQDEEISLTDEKSRETHSATFVAYCRKFAFFVFLGAFGLFLFMYSGWIYSATGYTDWSPSPKYNAIPYVDTNGALHFNPFCSRRSQKFKTRSKAKNDLLFKEIMSKFNSRFKLEESEHRLYEGTSEEENQKTETFSTVDEEPMNNNEGLSNSNGV